MFIFLIEDPGNYHAGYHNTDYQTITLFVTFAEVVLQFSSVQLLSCARLFVTPWTTAHQASLSITNSQNLPKLMSIELVMPSNHLLPSIFLLIRVFSNDLILKNANQEGGQYQGHYKIWQNIQNYDCQTLRHQTTVIFPKYCHQ